MTTIQEVNAAALPRLPQILEALLPGGRFLANQYRLGSGLRVNAMTGEWQDTEHDLRGTGPVSLLAALRYGGNEGAAAREIGKAIGLYVNGLGTEAAERGTLFALDAVEARPEAPVMLCQGQDAVTAASRLWPEYVVVGWDGEPDADALEALADRDVLIWPVNNWAGVEQGERIKAGLPQSVVLDVSDLPALASPATLNFDDPGQWLRERIGGHDDEAEPAPQQEEEEDEPPPLHLTGEPQPYEVPDQGHAEDVMPLGYDRGLYYYYSTATRQVTALKPGEHNRAGLAGIASAARYWEPSFPQFMGKEGISWAALADHLMTACRDRGIYDPARVRGRGAWIDNGRPLLHTGDALIIAGEPHPLNLPDSHFIYEAAPRLAVSNAAPLLNMDAHWLSKVCDLLRWERRVSSRLLAGWIAIAPICGALAWRPAIWLTGSSGSGKSYIREQIIGTALGAMVLSAQSATTEAGIRHALNSDALPVIFDEAEREDEQAARRMQGVMDLVRQSSSEGGAVIFKGTATQSGVKRYRIRSCFAFQSINVALVHQADANRVSVLALRDHSRPGDIDFADLDAVVRERITPAFSAGMIARSVSLIPQIRANAETFARAIAAGLGNRRLGDQLGTLLAGAYSLHSTGLITLEAASAYVSREEWLEDAPADEDKDEYRLLRHLLASRLRVGTVEVPISRLLESSAADEMDNPPVEPATAKRTLSEAGIKFDKRHGEPGIYVSTNHPELRRVLRGTPWDAQWSRTLARLPNTETGRGISVRFALGHVTRAVWVPMVTIDPIQGAGGQ